MLVQILILFMLLADDLPGERRVYGRGVPAAVRRALLPDHLAVPRRAGGGPLRGFAVPGPRAARAGLDARRAVRAGRAAHPPQRSLLACARRPRPPALRRRRRRRNPADAHRSPLSRRQVPAGPLTPILFSCSPFSSHFVFSLSFTSMFSCTVCASLLCAHFSVII